MFTGKAWDGVSTKGREPVFRIKSIIEKALFGGKENRAFLVEFACCGRELLRDREAFGLCGKRFFVALCCLGKIPGGAPFSQLHKGGFFFFALCCLGKIPGGAPISQLHKGGKQSREDRP